MQATNAIFGDPIDRSAAGFFPMAEVTAIADTGALSVTLVRLAAIDDALRAEWQALTKASPRPNPYFAPWFLEPAMRHLDPSGEVKVCLLRRADTGLLVGLAPLVFQKGYAKLPLKHACIWTHRHCFNGAPMIREGFDVAVYGGLFDWIDTRPEGASFFRFGMLPFDQATHLALEEACDLRQRSFRVQDYHERAILTSGNDFDSVMSAAMSGKKRKELRRQERRFGELGEVDVSSVSLSALNSPAAVDGLASKFLELENAGWKKTNPDGFPLAQSVAESRFFREVLTEGADADAVDCLSMSLDGDAKVMLFTLRLGKHRAAFKTSYDESLAAYSPGVRTLIEATRQMLDSDAEVLDSCACPGHPVVDGLWSERLPITQINVPANRVADKTLLSTAAALETIKNRALKRLNIR